MASDAPGFAILGAGIFAKEAHLPAIASLAGSNISPVLKAIYSRSEKSALDLASAANNTLKLATPPSIYHDGDPSTDLDALLARSDIRAVIVVLPITTQPSIVLKALAAGKHVLSEKPIAPDVAGAIELIRKYESEYKPKGLVWRVAENYETEPIYQRAAQAIQDGKIGKVLFFKARITNYMDKNSKWYKTPWRTVPDYQGGFLLDGGVHFAAALRIMLPSPLTHLSAFASLSKAHLAPKDTIHAIAKSAHDGAHGLFEVTFAAPSNEYTPGNGYTITGSTGWLTVGAAAVEEGKKQAMQLVLHNERGEEEVIVEESTGVNDEVRSFFGAVIGNDDEKQNPRGALKDLAFIQAALNSEGSLVDLEALSKM